MHTSKKLVAVFTGKYPPPTSSARFRTAYRSGRYGLVCMAWYSAGATVASPNVSTRTKLSRPRGWISQEETRMATRTLSVPEQTWHAEHETKNEAHSSGVSWAAVFAGAFVAAALSLILVALGTGIGLSAISPWDGAGASASSVGKGAIVWLILTELIASSIGGYLAGRLRTKWVNVHTDEVYFRDTAHGFLVWAVGLVITAAFLASAVASMLAGTAQRSATTVSAADPNAYFVDALFRSDSPSQGQNNASVNAEAESIL